MSFWKIAGITAAILCAVSFLVVFMIGVAGISTYNYEITLRTQFEGQLKVNESSFDKTWKVIQQQAQVASSERESFRKVYTEIMQAQQGVAGNGQLASFFTQAKVDVSPDLFAKLMTSIEAQRESFHRDQMKLAQIKVDHDRVLSRFPGNIVFWIFPKNPLELKMITSDRTNEAFASGVDNNVDLNL